MLKRKTGKAENEALAELLIIHQSLDKAEQEKFVSFLLFCDERLQKGVTKQEIWKEWQEVTA